MTTPEVRAEFLAGVERATAYWAAYYRREHAAAPQALAQAHGHALRALAWHVTCVDSVDIAVELVAAMQDTLMYQGQWCEWEALLRQLLAKADVAANQEYQVMLRGAISSICYRTGRIEESTTLATQLYHEATSSGQPLRQAGAALGLAEAYLSAGAADRALVYAEEVTTLGAAHNQPRFEADGLIDAARALIDLGDLAEAERRLLRAVEITASADLTPFLAKARLFLGHVARHRQHWQAALAHYETALALVTGYGDKVGRATIQSAQALALAAVGRREEAISLLEDAVRVLRHHGNVPAEQVALQRLAELRSPRASTQDSGDVEKEHTPCIQPPPSPDARSCTPQPLAR